MATTAEPPLRAEPNKKRAGKRTTDPFGGGAPMALAAITITLVGFWRSFFAKLGDIDAVHMWHGATSTGWLVFVLVQASLISSRKYKWHRVLGWSSVLLFASLLVSSWIVLALMLSGKSGIPLEFAKLPAYSDITAVPLMIICYAGAIYLRKDRHVHSRLVSVTLLAGLLPAISRMFNLIWSGPVGFFFSMHLTYIFVLAILATAIFVDWKKDRLRWPFPFCFAWLAICYATLLPGAYSQWFDHLAKAIAATA